MVHKKINKKKNKKNNKTVEAQLIKQNLKRCNQILKEPLSVISVSQQQQQQQRCWEVLRPLWEPVQHS